MDLMRFVWLMLIGTMCSAFDKDATEVVVMDTMKQSALNWDIWPDDGSPWQELSWTNPETDAQHKGYHVCSVGEVVVDNWFRTPYIRFEEDVTTVYVNISFLMRECTDYPERYYQCRTTFSVLKYESDLDFASASTPAWNEDDYDVVKTVPADHTYTNPETDDVTANNVTFSFEKSLKGFYLAVRDSGMCSFILSMQIWYRRCPAKIIRHTVLRSTPADDNIVTVYGQCVENAVIANPSQTLEFLCTNLGKWFNPTNSKGCVCNPGFEPSGDQCDRCPVGKYKSKAENEECKLCPGNSLSNTTGLRECICHNGFYRSSTEGAEVKCTKPPSEIRELINERVSDDSVILRWKPPIYNGGRSDLYYRVECDLCSAVASTVFNETSATIANLVPNTRYVVTVYALNGVSSVAPAAIGQTIEFVTLEGSAPKNKITKTQSTHNTLELSWPPVNQAASYQVEWYPREEIDKKQVLRVQEHSVKLENLEPSTTYSILVKYYDISDKPIGETEEQIYSTDKSEDLVLMISLAIGAVIVCMAIVIVIVVMFLRKTNNREQGNSCIPKNILALFRSKQQCDKPHSDCEGLGPYTNVPFHITNSSQETTMNMPLFGQQSVQKVKTYVDPHTYEDPRQAVKEFTKEINVSCITIEAVIGGGEFGDVCRGKLKVVNKPEMCVAIKTLKPGASEKNRLDFLTEASIMGQFDDPNVIFLEGVVTKSNPIMIVTEYMENGSLDTFLRANDGKLSMIQLLNMLRGISSGMTYLSGMSYVHRDLAARNILVNESLVCKVADFGLSREVEYDTSEGAYTTRGGKIPVRWTAPEAISHRKFTSASDIWSFGVVMWEVISYGERPYWDWSNQEVIKTVDKGYRLPPPMDCPEAVHQLMLDCWQKDRKNRPKFSAVQTTIDRLMASPDLLKKLAKATIQHTLFDNEMNEVSHQMTVSEWLKMIKMDRYTEAFEQKGIYTMEQVAWLTFADLLEMGVTLVGHQKKIMSSAQSLRPQFDGTASPVTMSEGFLV